MDEVDLSVLEQRARLFHDSTEPMNLGCMNCVDQDLCGGLHAVEQSFGCQSYCTCTDPESCTFVCPKQPAATFVARIREVEGFDLETVPRHPAAVDGSQLPALVPLLYHRSRRVESLRAKAVAIRLADLFQRKSGTPKYRSRKELAQAFAFDPTAQVVITGISQDPPLEDYWSQARRADLPLALKRLRPALVTTPNFSLFTNVPRWDNLHSMKRIAICWSELAAAGLPTALHVNARTDRDWDRWKVFLGNRPAIRTIAFEFATGGAMRGRAEWHVGKLKQLGDASDRMLKLAVRGGRQHLASLKASFGQVVYLDTDAFIKTIRRQKRCQDPTGRRRWRRVLTLEQQPLDDLLQYNLETLSDEMVNTDCPHHETTQG